MIFALERGGRRGRRSSVSAAGVHTMMSSACASPSSPRWLPSRTAPPGATRRQRSSESSAGQFRGSHSSRRSPPLRRHAAEKSSQAPLLRDVRFIRSVRGLRLASDQGLRPVPEHGRAPACVALKQRFAVTLVAPHRGIESNEKIDAFYVYSRRRKQRGQLRIELT